MPPNWMIGHYLAIHRGKGVDSAGLKFVLKRGYPVGDIYAQPRPSGIVAIAKLVGVISTTDQLTRHGDADWYAPGQYGWLLDDIIPIPLIPCSGSLKLWRLEDGLKDAVLTAWRAEKLARREAATVTA